MTMCNNVLCHINNLLIYIKYYEHTISNIATNSDHIFFLFCHLQELDKVKSDQLLNYKALKEKIIPTEFVLSLCIFSHDFLFSKTSFINFFILIFSVKYGTEGI